MCDNTSRSRPNFFPYRKDCLFSKLSVFNSLLDPKKSSYKFQSKCQNSLHTLIFCFFIFVTLDVRGKRAKLFVILKTASFSNVCSYQVLRSQTIDVITCTIIGKIPCGPLLIIPGHLSCPIITKKTGQSFIIIGEIAFFCQKISVRNGL